MTERDEIAKMAMQGILSGGGLWKDSRLETEKVAEYAYLMADAMLQEQTKTPKKRIPPPTPMPSHGM